MMLGKEDKIKEQLKNIFYSLLSFKSFSEVSDIIDECLDEAVYLRAKEDLNKYKEVR